MQKEPLKTKLKNSTMQSVLVSLSVLVCFVLMRYVANGLVLASIGASAFIAFAFPNAESSRPRYLVGGYACGIGAGLAGHGVYQLLLLGASEAGDPFFLLALGCVLSAFLAAFFMMLLDLQHPPSVALAISIVATSQPLQMSLIALLCILALVLIKTLWTRSKKGRESK